MFSHSGSVPKKRTTKEVCKHNRDHSVLNSVNYMVGGTNRKRSCRCQPQHLLQRRLRSVEFVDILSMYPVQPPLTLVSVLR